MSAAPTHDDLDAFRATLAEATGLRFPENRTPALVQTLRARASELATPVPTYVEHLKDNPREFGELARSLTVSETYFLRNPDQFRVLEHLIRRRDSEGLRHLRLLSAGCSSGEEAYSLAITICETVDDPRTWNVTIVGLDLNPAVLERARAAVYTTWSLRELPDRLRDKYFRRDGDSFALHDAVKGMVRFEPQNLVAPTMVLWSCETFDVIFCRNVLMYFSSEAARLVVKTFEHALRPGGHLFLGHAEHLRGLSSAFDLRHQHDTFYYVRLSDSAREPCDDSTVPDGPAGDSTVSWFEAIARSADRVAKLLLGTGAPSKDASPPTAAEDPWTLALALMAQERFSEALQTVDALVPPPLKAKVLRATLLLSLGQIDGAEVECTGILAIEALHAEAYYVLALCREHAGDAHGAIDRSQTASYLDSTFAMPHLQRGRLARRRGDFATARRELCAAQVLLPTELAERIALFGGGFGRSALLGICRGELNACGEQR